MRRRKAAYVDEAYEPGPGGGYVLAAVVAPSDTAALRRELSDALQLRGQDRPHFTKEDHKRRVVLAESVAGLGLPATVVVERSAGRALRERGRCLATLAWELDEEVDAIVFESRGRQQDQHDAWALARIAQYGPRFTTRFVRPTAEPALWVADIIASAVFQDVVRGNPAYRGAVGDLRIVSL